MFHDKTTGLYHATHRVYDPLVGRWLSRDPIGEQGGVNLYEYVGGNPVAAVYPSGLQLLPLFARPPIVPDMPEFERPFKIPRSRMSGKEGAKDVPSSCKGQRPYKGESGKDFAKRLMDDKYGADNYDKGPTSEYNQIQKYGDRNFQDPASLTGIDQGSDDDDDEY